LEFNRDRSNEMRACVQQLQHRAVDARSRALQASFRERSQHDLSQIYLDLRQSGVGTDTLYSAFQPFLLRLPGENSAGNSPAASRRPRRGTAAADTPRQPKSKKQRRGNKNLPSRDGMRKWTAERKLHFMVQVKDVNTARYIDADRQWLVKSNPIANCFERCCNSNVQQFLQLHTVGKSNFSVEAVYKSKLSSCPRCSRH
jgi:hypothetical protein